MYDDVSRLDREGQAAHEVTTMHSSTVAMPSFVSDDHRRLGMEGWSSIYTHIEDLEPSYQAQLLPHDSPTTTWSNH